VDKKAKDGRLRFIVLERIGAASVRADVPAAVLDETLASVAAA
jgi:3-dehydroquinate synthetase